VSEQHSTTVLNGGFGRRGAALIAVAAALALTAPAAAAESLVSTSLSAAESVDRDCTTRELTGAAGVDSVAVTAPAFGMVDARLSATGGDWDLAVLDSQTGETVAGSAYQGSGEVAQGFVGEGQELIVQACRRSGETGEAELRVDTAAIDQDENATARLVEVVVPSDDAMTRLQGLGLDLTEHAGAGSAQVVAYGRSDLETLQDAGFEYDVVVNDLAKQSARQREADAQYADDIETSALPSGRTTYRRLFDYGEEMKALAAANPDLVKPITLPFRTYEGRAVEGIEITTNPNALDGKPVFLQMGVHHAREWPSGEHAMEWAYELINGFRAGDPRVTRLVGSTRTIIVPIVNPDGFNTSREAGQALGFGGGRGGNDTANIASSPFEYRRKNCRFVDDSEAGSCVQPSVGLAEPGVDPNRNYGGFWGGPGASTVQTAPDYRGPGPFSEPETKNVRELVSRNQVTTLITNHTFSALVLRPPGVSSQPDPIDEPIFKALADAMAAQNGYVSQKGYELYDTSGTTEDWSYNATGGLGFTFEIGCNGTPPKGCVGNFHPPYQEVVAEYDGSSSLAQAVGGGGNRAAYFLAQENTADASKHSVITGKAPELATLRLQKTFETPTSPVLDANGEEGAVQSLTDHLETTLEVPDSGSFNWHVNPSTRPLVAQSTGRAPNGNPSPAQQFSGAAFPPVPGGAQPCADFETDDPTCWNDHAFTVPAGPGIDNAAATVSIKWATPTNDWDMKVFVDANGDGSSVGETQKVGQSAQGVTTSESTTFVEPLLQPGQQYVIRVVNFAAVEPYDGTVNFEGPQPFQAAQTEQWMLTCEFPAGNVLSSQQLAINRAESKSLDLDKDCRIGKEAAKAACKSAPTIKGDGKRNKIKGTAGSDVIAAKGGKDRVKAGKGDDVICLGRGRDKASAGSGDDIVIGGGGADNVKGGSGADQLFGNRSKDLLRGGSGKDRCQGGPGRDKLKSC